jgi:DNA polymerase-4
MDAFFISCESTRHPEISGIPAAVAGDPRKRCGIILTANYEARKFGIKTAMTLNNALKLCPDLAVIAPDHNFYRFKSNEVIDILFSYTPTIEQNSIDEAWLDMTGCERIFGNPRKCAEDIMKQIGKELGLSCSIGISENKFLSKMASEIKKPSSITELWRKDIEKKLWNLPVESMYGIGKHTAEKLRNMKINTIGEIANYNKNILIKKLGKSGSEIYELANGIDDSPVKPHSHDDIKSIGKSVTLSKDICNIDQAKRILMQLSDKVGMAARKQNKKGRIVTISIKYNNFKTITRRTTIKETFLVKEIYSAGVGLLEKNWNSQMPVRLLGVTLSGFINNHEGKQISIFDISKTRNMETSRNKYDKIEAVIEYIRRKYGYSIINRAVLLNKKNKR